MLNTVRNAERRKCRHTKRQKDMCTKYKKRSNQSRVGWESTKEAHQQCSASSRKQNAVCTSLLHNWTISVFHQSDHKCNASSHCWAMWMLTQEPPDTTSGLCVGSAEEVHPGITRYHLFTELLWIMSWVRGRYSDFLNLRIILHIDNAKDDDCWLKVVRQQLE